ncbi:[FeFe] hydrogenase H-cluster maturation GTPase HydF [Blautia schinkii]|uniref:[FeFe] hydrogenase H-cluster maturation GTPase HydF n=1 Tax=Blautia schinkii TaxID=180164 RepID=UPI00156FFD1F|nr:[FeFe] hydrogenase H-cluster maturation GTPase HydF [Blautia schinkii]NSG83389.1 [FeFe] hydrogenase H-cluster maturation GTPase HydF [Blautia schinkii]NSK23995.1 [FeFe] hydrogenase H-cluster maturation GTPase HydF [Blautia schinkii]NSK27032.1 [FeFe] hydrogenase H-cluster maturation GTPase HydF [Blautia schinkii]NSK33300.1 [FeFe] hydrogenase H-cluster maturation GTPase HydF [Blautia schinkii]NSK50629.1 [FeFe] hydrogenase H-cluster maturation GTPase HydF [Blautia schinkii]
MGMNETPSADRVHIGFFGKRNAGKSSIVNKVTGQELAVVSDVKGTTTDPVSKAMELLPLGPVVIIDTPGIDDEGHLGELRVRKANQVLNRVDVAVLVVDATVGKTSVDEELIRIFKEKEIPYLVVYNKADLLKTKDGNRLSSENKLNQNAEQSIYASAVTGQNIYELKERIASLAVTDELKLRLVGDLLEPSDFVILVVPIDKAAPKGRLILPQQQTIRDVLEAGAAAIVIKEDELSNALENLGKKPKLVITDSQVFAKVSKETPEDIWLTSFSILFARFKGNLKAAAAGAAAIDRLKDGDKILISEGCTHHRQCDDIGTVKLPRWIRNYTGKDLEFEYSSGRDFPEDVTKYSLIVHCGGCMLNEREMRYRQKCALDQEIPITNYGIAIAYMQGILKRCVEMFPDVLSVL